MKIQLKRSDVLEGGKAKQPTPPNMKDGELAINFNAIDPSFFIKDTNGNIRKLGINEAVNVQSDWSETNPGSPAYIKNKQLVTNELEDLQSQIDLKIEDPVDNKLYGRKKGQWSLIEVLEANKDGKGYVRKDGAWYAIENYGYATEAYADNVATAAGTAAYTTSVAYTDAEIQKLVNDINAEGFIREAPDSKQYTRQGTDDGTAGSWVELPPIIPEAPQDGEKYGRQTGAWVQINEGIEEANTDGEAYVRINASWGNLDDYLSGNTDLIGEAPTDGQKYGRQNSDWEVINEGVEEALSDGNGYIRSNQAWSNVEDFLKLNTDFIEDAQSDGKKYARLNGNWSEVNEGIADASSNGIGYVRLNGNWSDVDTYLSTNTDFLKDAAENGRIYGRKDGQWAEIEFPDEAGVISFNGRGGAVVPQAADYAAFYAAISDLDDYVTTNLANATYLSKDDAADTYLTEAQADGLYQPLGNYALNSNVYSKNEVYTKTESDDIYEFKGAGSGFNQAQADLLYQPIGDYLTPTTGDDRYYTQSQSNDRYQAKGEYLTQGDTDNRYYTKDESDNIFLTQGDADIRYEFKGASGSGFSKTEADTYYAPIDDYVSIATAEGTYASYAYLGANYETANTANSKYLTENTANTLYQPAGNYVTANEIINANFVTRDYADAAYAPAGDYITVTDATNNFYLKTQTYTKSETNTQITSQGYITQSTADGKYLTSTSGYTQNAANATFVDFASNQNITGVKRFRNDIILTNNNEIGIVTNVKQNTPGVEPDAWPIIGDKFFITRNGEAGLPSEFDPNDSNTNGTGGITIHFRSNRTPRVGFQVFDPQAALHVQAAMRARDYQNAAGSYSFDGQLFTGPADGQSYFENTCFFHKTLIQTQPTAFRIPDTEATTTAVITDAERRVATNLRNALRGRIANGKRLFSIDKASLVSAFSDEGLDITDYEIIQEITQDGHDGYLAEDENANDFAGVPTETFTTVDYQALFAFTLAAGPDLSAIESRLAALEAANS